MMPPTAVHFNGGVNLADTETVMREIASRVPKGVTRIPDGETGDRQNWIWFQLDKFLQTPGLESDKPVDMAVESAEYVQMPKVRLTVDADEIEWPNLGYADVYQDSFATFDRLQSDGVIPAGVRFQVEYPTPLASINAWLVEADQDSVEPSYEKALFGDLNRLLDAVPHDRIVVQWDVAVEFGMLRDEPDRQAGLRGGLRRADVREAGAGRRVDSLRVGWKALDQHTARLREPRGARASGNRSS